jgi:hypothetical protein
MTAMTDSDIKDLGIWAVNHHNRKANDQLVFQNVVGARQQNSSHGFYHKIVITALDAVHMTHSYDVSLFIVDNVNKTDISLLSFNVSNVLI